MDLARTSSEGVKGENPAEEVFLAVFRRWRFDPQAPARWRDSPAEALAWFREEAAAVAGVDLEQEVRAFGRWLEGKAREPVRNGHARFPASWRNTLINWLRRNAGAARGPHAATRRGEDPAGRADYGGFSGRGANDDDINGF